MKAILLSVNPQPTCNILNGIKVDEIRKSMPRCALPIDVYIYCTKGAYLYKSNNTGKFYTTKCKSFPKYTIYGDPNNLVALNGKVVAKFTLNKIDEYECEFDKRSDVSQHIIQVWRDDRESPSEVSYAKIIASNERDDPNNGALLQNACLTFEDVQKYCNYDNATLYAWHIDDLIIFDEPMELTEFEKPATARFTKSAIDMCEGLGFVCHAGKLTRPPQSWQFVEVP